MYLEMVCVSPRCFSEGKHGKPTTTSDRVLPAGKRTSLRPRKTSYKSPLTPSDRRLDVRCLFHYLSTLLTATVSFFVFLIFFKNLYPYSVETVKAGMSISEVRVCLFVGCLLNVPATF